MRDGLVTLRLLSSSCKPEVDIDVDAPEIAKVGPVDPGVIRTRVPEKKTNSKSIR